MPGSWIERAKDSPGRAADPIASLELCGNMYLRVPNKPGTEEPVFTPPDAVPVSFQKMLQLDKEEMDARVRWAMNNCSYGC